jgi:lysophospholipase L1-like esterase
MLHCGYVDVTAISRQGADSDDALVADGLHPSAAMYRRWAEAILPAAKAALSSP